MNRILEYNILEKENGVTLRDYLAAQGYSPNIMTKLKGIPDGVLRNGEKMRYKDRLSTGDHVRIHLVERKSSDNILPVMLPLGIEYEDEDIIVINKPAHMPIQPSIGNHENTLANGLAYYFQLQGEEFVYRCINRLDRDTTGLLIVAKHMLSASILSDMMVHRKIEREYLAIATGKVPEEGQITLPIARADESIIERVVDEEHGEYACTNYKRMAYKNGYSLVSLRLETGRTHQIRVHLKAIGHPIPGDFLYNPDYTVIDRQALHSHLLRFPHPTTRQTMEFEAPLPADMAAIIYEGK